MKTHRTSRGILQAEGADVSGMERVVLILLRPRNGIRPLPVSRLELGRTRTGSVVPHANRVVWSVRLVLLSIVRCVAGSVLWRIAQHCGSRCEQMGRVG